ncbi:class I SAM-dependent methyltransferase [Oceanirhabdus sp. W0125-5]|uniref:class I SAM-dependent methyltransferase n=1 Tax=Oceanirhabdus sp. W0125-5 TaxID=2999116 RepID=UPI0022F32ECF|nr:class I SAM-dependent methyltransferase [Oceanirhabdus sp. W0125-5]WBW98858.1 class I SAM-dependent methyltransferase [Oceanirhabdus sp. W0125-5]
MKPIFRQNQLFTFLLYCNGQGLEKNILDCGAGGMLPPLALFKEHGYETTGIDISEKAIERANEFQNEQGINLNITKGDMKALSFDDNSFSFCYSYNTIFHMSKKEIKKSLEEMKRVLVPGGLMFINFVSTADERCGRGEEVGAGEYYEMEHGEKVLHSYFHENEGEEIFEELGLKRIYKEVRKRIGPKRGGGFVTLGYIDYILEKPL